MQLFIGGKSFMRKYNIGWGLTSLCNMHCAFCYSHETRERSDDISISDWIRFVDENYQQIDSINYGTGENSIIDDFFKFIEYVRDKYPTISQSVTTNGYIAQRINENPELKRIFLKSIDEIDVSLDFADREKHCSFRGQEYAYDWAIKTLSDLKETDKKVTIVFIGCEDSLKKDNIDGLFAIAKKYNTILRLNIYRPVSDNKSINDRFLLSSNTLYSALEYINSKYRVISLSDILLGNIFTPDNNITENTGIGSIRILPDGKICPSTYLINAKYSSKYSIKQKNVLSHIHFPEFEEALIPNECMDCPIKEKCKGGVYDRRILWYGTLKERDPYCPTRFGEIINKRKFNVAPHERISIHDMYLPTLFFSNKEN